MLVLTRKSNEKIRIGDDIVITVLRTKGKAVRLGIEAPEEMRVLRGEIAFEQDAEADDEEPQDRHTLRTRVPRSELASVLPHLAASGGPLSGFINGAAAEVQ